MAQYLYYTAVCTLLSNFENPPLPPLRLATNRHRCHYLIFIHSPHCFWIAGCPPCTSIYHSIFFSLSFLFLTTFTRSSFLASFRAPQHTLARSSRLKALLWVLRTRPYLPCSVPVVWRFKTRYRCYSFHFFFFLWMWFVCKLELFLSSCWGYIGYPRRTFYRRWNELCFFIFCRDVLIFMMHIFLYHRRKHTLNCLYDFFFRHCSTNFFFQQI